MPTPGSGVLDGILDVTKESLTESNLTNKGTTLTGSSSKEQSTSVANTTQATDSVKGEGEARPTIPCCLKGGISKTLCQSDPEPSHNGTNPVSKQQENQQLMPL